MRRRKRSRRGRDHGPAAWALLSPAASTLEISSYRAPRPNPGAGPSAKESVGFWAGKDGCAASAMGAAIDLDTAVAAEETSVEQWAGCAGGVSLWTLRGVGHVPTFNTTWSPRIVDCTTERLLRQT